jgi:putative oxidoreductase
MTVPALRDRRIVLLAQVAIAIVLVVAALAKIGDADSFARQIHRYQLVPFGLENLAAITLPWIELVAALAILSRVQPRAGAAVGAVFMALFWIAVAAAMARGLDIECGCFGTADATRVGLGKLIENTALLAVAVVGSLRPRQ